MLSRLRSAASPESGTIQYTYDANGNLTGKTDARGVATAYTYDRLNRVTARGYSDSTPAVAYFYDNLANAKGKLIKVASSVSTTEYTAFDILGRVTAHKQSTNGTAYNTAYSYNLSGALIEETYPSGRKVKNTLNAVDGNLSLVETQASGGAWQTRAGSFAYNAAGAVTSMQLGNGRWESTVFNNRLQPTQIALGTTQNGTDLLKLEYGYGTTDNNGNVQSQTITVPGVAHPFVQTYTYDLLNRLKSAEEKSNNVTTWKQTFTYDRYGNRNFDTTNSNTTTLGSCAATICNPTVDAANNRFDAGQGYTYDNAGNTTADAEGRTFAYDAENKQVSVSDASGAIGQYHYDGDGKRVKKSASTGDDTVFVYDAAGKLVEERAASTGALQTSYVYAGSRLLSTETSSGTSYLTADRLGSARINTDQSGTITARHDYHPFGEEIARTGYGADTIHKRFTGYERDGETGLEYAQARYYGSTTGRFLVADPLASSARRTNPQSWNRYSFVWNNPVNAFDPDGLDVKFLDEKAIDNVLNTLPKALRERVKKAMKNGVLGKKSLDRIKSNDANFQDLRAMANDSKTIEVMTSDTDPRPGGEKFYWKTKEEQQKEIYDLYLKSGSSPQEAKAAADAIEEPRPGTFELNGGVILRPDETESRNWRVVLPDFTGDAADFPLVERAVTSAHEVYGHGLPGMQGKPFRHEDDRNGPNNVHHRKVEERTRALYREPRKTIRPK
jgi:RHS repeat-associated protein